LLVVLRNHIVYFAWDYKDMKGIHIGIYTHHIYIKYYCIPIRKPQRRMNPSLKDIVKEELQKLLDAGFIYPISDSEWVSPLVIVPNEEWKMESVCGLQKSTKPLGKYHFPFPFIDQVLDVLAGKNTSHS
jgi:hypothetical protein